MLQLIQYNKVFELNVKCFQAGGMHFSLNNLFQANWLCWMDPDTRKIGQGSVGKRSPTLLIRCQSSKLWRIQSCGQAAFGHAKNRKIQLIFRFHKRRKECISFWEAECPGQVELFPRATDPRHFNLFCGLLS
uniref:Uncharacterized protein n=1 Tax=Micrurus lemniscatus lemniscatus TaxID=129467 RepID=A0A2D4J8P9_MICLE